MKLKITNTFKALGAATLIAGLAACGSGDAPKEETIAVKDVDPATKTLIESRQKNFKTLAGNFKTVREANKAGELNSPEVIAALTTMSALAGELTTWFPAGSGPETGVKMEALPAIWEDKATFETLAGDLNAAITETKTALEAGEFEKASAMANSIGKNCGACHDKFKAD